MTANAIFGSLFTLLALASTLVSSRALAVDSPPQLLDFQVLTASVDSSAGPASTLFQAEIVDPAPGVCTTVCDDFGTASHLQLVHSATGQRHSAPFVQISGDDYSAVVTLPTVSAGGIWQVESVWLADFAGNRQVLSTADLTSAGFATNVNNLSAAGDTAGPIVTNLSLSATAINATSGASTFLSLMVTETGSGLCLAGCSVAGGPSQVRYSHAATGQVRDAILSLFGGSPAADIEFPAGSADGLWTVDSLQLVDVAGNRTSLDNAALADLGFITELTVTSSSADLVPPTLISGTSFPYPIDTTSGGVAAQYDADADDAGTGLCVDVCDDFGTASQVVYQRDGSDHVRFGLLELTGGSLFSGNFDALVDLPISGAPNVWRARGLLLVDRAGNRNFVPEPGFGGGLAFGLLAMGLLGSTRSGFVRA